MENYLLSFEEQNIVKDYNQQQEARKKVNNLGDIFHYLRFYKEELECLKGVKNSQ